MNPIQELLLAFSLGNSSILSNVCILPLYPGLIAYLASTMETGNKKATKWLGFFVLGGVLSLMIAIGAILYLLNQSISQYLTVILPMIYGLVLILGVLLLLGKNPFKKMQTVQVPLLKNPYIGAFTYGLFLAPMTLPCTGPTIVTAFATGAGANNSMVFSILYFIVFGIGFGWPLILLPILSSAVQRKLIQFMTKNVHIMNILSGLLLIGIALYGLYFDWWLIR